MSEEKTPKVVDFPRERMVRTPAEIAAGPELKEIFFQAFSFLEKYSSSLSHTDLAQWQIDNREQERDEILKSLSDKKITDIAALFGTELKAFQRTPHNDPGQAPPWHLLVIGTEFINQYNKFNSAK